MFGFLLDIEGTTGAHRFDSCKYGEKRTYYFTILFFFFKKFHKFYLACSTPLFYNSSSYW